MSSLVPAGPLIFPSGGVHRPREYRQRLSLPIALASPHRCLHGSDHAGLVENWPQEWLCQMKPREALPGRTWLADY